MLKSPLRYPGGKSKVLGKFDKFIPSFNEYREPMVGGGSVFLMLKSHNQNKAKFWVNDINFRVYSLWKMIADKNGDLTKEIRNYINLDIDNAKSIVNEFKKSEVTDCTFQEAIKFFVINRSTFSGVESGGFSKQAYNKRFTESSIQRIEKLKGEIDNVRITNLDYENLVNDPGNDVFIYLDPPYFSNKNNALYGKNGELHRDFDHERLLKEVRKSKHKILITYDDCPEIREMYSWAQIYEFDFKYGMTNVSNSKCTSGKELFIVINYSIE